MSSFNYYILSAFCNISFSKSLFSRLYSKGIANCVFVVDCGKDKRPRKIINIFLKIFVMDMEVFSRLDSKGIEHFNRKLYLQVCFQFVDPMSKMTPIIVILL